MPIYEYAATDAGRSCEHCVKGFEILSRLSDPPLLTCPQCGAAVRKQISAPRIGSSQSGYDDRAKAAGFSKLKRLGKGEYERQY